MSERLAFVQACIRRRSPIAEICLEFGISEKTGYKVLARFATEGPAGLADRSHARHAQAHRVAPVLVARLVALRKQHPQYGPAKLRDWVRQREPGTAWPASSTIGEILKREGLIRPRRRRAPAHAAFESGRTAATAPNVVWTADFKGQFALGSHGPLCYPLTILDLHSHFLLRCTALASTAVRTARQSFERCFREFGLPAVIRTDNGVPFAQPNALGRLGSLAFWWIRLGIRPEHIPLGRPAANGAHERFHKTLKAHTVRPAAAASVRAQQQRFDRFQREYNDDRPHASLAGHCPPGAHYRASERPYPHRVPPVCYPDGAIVRLVSSNGSIRVHNRAHFLTANLAGEYIQLAETDDEMLRVVYSGLQLGEICRATNRFTPHVRWLPELTPSP